MTRCRFISLIVASLLGLLIAFTALDYTFLTSPFFPLLHTNYRRRPECTCLRPALSPLLSSFKLEQNENRLARCSQYSIQRGPSQRIISISLFGPKEAKRFGLHQTLRYLTLLIKDINTIYSDGFVLRIYHDTTINATTVICPIECEHPNVDFCDMNDKLYIPPKIWRFIPAADPLVDISE